MSYFSETYRESDLHVVGKTAAAVVVMLPGPELLLVLVAARVLDVPNKIFLVRRNKNTLGREVYRNRQYLSNVSHYYLTLKRKSHEAKNDSYRAEHFLLNRVNF